MTKNDITKENYVEDEILQNLLNDKGEIQIEDKLFTVNNATQEITMTNLTEKIEKIYKFDENVLQKEFYKDSIKNDKIDYPSTCNPNYTDKRFFNSKISFKVAYFKYGIYFTLVSKIKINPRNSNIIIGTMATGSYSYRKKHRIVTYDYTTNWKEGRNAKYKVRPYWGIKRLTAYIITGTFKISVFNTHYGYWQTYYYESRCPCEK